MPSSARSLAEDLRARSDDQLVRLFTKRPALLRPVPKSFSDLALRANSAPSTITALDALTAAELDVLEAACALAPAGRFSLADLATGLDSDPAVVGPLVTELYDRVLLWGGSGDLRVPSAVREVLGPEPCGLDSIVRANQTGVRRAMADPAAFADRLSLAPDDARELLIGCAWGPATVPIGPGHDWLVAQDFMAVDDAGRLIVAREIALLIRRGQLIADPRLTPPQLPPVDARRLAAADQHAGHAADQFVRDVDRVLAYLASGALGRQANGAFPARDWDRMIVSVGLPPAQLGVILALAWTTQWADWDDENRLRPTTQYQASVGLPVAQRWAELAHTWLRMPLPPPSDPARSLAVAPDPQVAGARALVLAGITAGARRDVTAWLGWYRPRLDPPSALISTTLAEADALGFSFGGEPTSVARLVDPSRTELAQTLAAHLPPLTDRIVLQADLTATALGPLDPAVERRLGETADWESGGAASVFRFSADSVRSALARGATAPELIEWLTAVSATPLPQALTVLITDQATGLPSMSVHEAGAVITCAPDEVADLLADPALSHLILHEVAPGTVIARAGSDEVARAILESGRAASRPDADSRPVTPHRPPVHRSAQAPAPQRVVDSLRNVERGDLRTPVPPGELPPAGPAQILAELRDAVTGHRRIWLSFAADQGDRVTHLIEPLQLEAGDVCAFDHTAGEIRMIPLSRIVASAAA